MGTTDTEFDVLVGLNFTPEGAKKEKRFEPGSTVKRSEFPKKADVQGLIDQGVLVPKGGDA